MRTSLLGPALFGLLLSYTPATALGPGTAATVAAYCGLDRLDVTTDGATTTVRATVTGRALVHDPAVSSRAAGATLRCDLRSGGVTLARTAPVRDVTLLATNQVVTYTTTSTGLPKVCAHLDLDGGGTYDSCARSLVAPDALAGVLGLLKTRAAIGPVDSLICPLLAALSPGVPGVDIRPEGDTYVVGLGFVWDCPPYGNGEPTDDPIQPIVDVIDNALAPSFPSCSVGMSGSELTPTTFSYGSCSPSIDQWTCVQDTHSSSCTPPGQPHRNRCAEVGVEASMSGNGAVHGRSGCTESSADAVSTGPPNSGQSSTPALFPWRCEVEPAMIGFWWVTCSVN